MFSPISSIFPGGSAPSSSKVENEERGPLAGEDIKLVETVKQGNQLVPKPIDTNLVTGAVSSKSYTVTQVGEKKDASKGKKSEDGGGSFLREVPDTQTAVLEKLLAEDSDNEFDNGNRNNSGNSRKQENRGQKNGQSLTLHGLATSETVDPRVKESQINNVPSNREERTVVNSLINPFSAASHNGLGSSKDPIDIFGTPVATQEIKSESSLRPAPNPMLNFDKWYNTTNSIPTIIADSTFISNFSTCRGEFVKMMLNLVEGYFYHSREIGLSDSLSDRKVTTSTSTSNVPQITNHGGQITNHGDSNQLTSFQTGQVAAASPKQDQGESSIVLQPPGDAAQQQEKLKTGLENIKVLFTAVKDRAYHHDNKIYQDSGASNNLVGKVSDLANACTQLVINLNPVNLNPVKNVEAIEKSFLDFYISQNMDFLTLCDAAKIQTDISRNERQFKEKSTQYNLLKNQNNIPTMELDKLEQQVASLQQSYDQSHKEKEVACKLCSNNKFCCLVGNHDLDPPTQIAQVMLMIEGITKMKSSMPADPINEEEIIKNYEPAERLTLQKNYLTSIKEEKNNHYVLWDANKHKLMTDEAYKKPPYSMISFFYAIGRTKDDSLLYQTAIKEVGKLVKEDYGPDAEVRFNIEFGGRYRSGRPLSYGALKNFLAQEKRLANGQDYVLQASEKGKQGPMGFLREEFEKSYSQVNDQNFSSEHKEILFKHFLKQHNKFVIVPNKVTNLMKVPALDKKNWWLWPSRRTTQDSNAYSLELLFKELKEVIKTDNKCEKYVFSTLIKVANEIELFDLCKKISESDDFLQQYLTVDKMMEVYKKAVSTTANNYEGAKGTFSLCQNLIWPYLKGATPWLQTAAAVSSASHANSLAQGVGNAAVTGAVLEGIPIQFRALAAGLYLVS